MLLGMGVIWLALIVGYGFLRFVTFNNYRHLIRYALVTTYCLALGFCGFGVPFFSENFLNLMDKVMIYSLASLAVVVPIGWIRDIFG